MRTLPSLCFRSFAKRFACVFFLLLCSASFVQRAHAQARCIAGSGTCSDSFTSASGTPVLTDYSSSWQKIKATGDAYLTGSGTITLNGTNYAYYSFTPSNSDTAQITVTASATRNNNTREACVRLNQGRGGYCVGLTAVSNGMYSGCFFEKMGSYFGNGTCPAMAANVDHTLAITASGTAPVSLTVYVDGVRTGSVTDSGQTITAGQPGLALIADGTPANNQIGEWQDVQGTPLTTFVMAATAPAYACPSGSGTCYDNFQGVGGTLLTQYNSFWTKVKATSDAALTGVSTVQIPGQTYAYYSYTPSTSDIAQITIAPSATKQGNAREACVRLQQGLGGYCVGFGAVSNGLYTSCSIERMGQYFGNVSCGSPSATVPHTLAMVATGTLPLVLQVYLDGVPVRAVADYVPLPKSHPGIALLGDGTAANSDLGAWRDYRDMATAAAPTFSPAAGTYSGVQSVAISSTSASAVIHYTTDGSTPTLLSPVYSNPVSVANALTLKAFAAVAGQTSSAVSSAAYQINLPPAAVPTFTVPSPYSGLATLVGIVNPAGAGQIQYCVDTTNTCTPSATYILPIPFASTG